MGDYVQLIGVKEQIAALKDMDGIFEEELTAAMRVGTLIGAGWAKQRAPVDTGRLRSSITGQVVASEGRMVRGLVGTNVVPYPELLETRDRFHYRAGPRKGEQTQGWLTQGVADAMDKILQQFEKAAERILKRLAGKNGH